MYTFCTLQLYSVQNCKQSSNHALEHAQITHDIASILNTPNHGLHNTVYYAQITHDIASILNTQNHVLHNTVYYTQITHDIASTLNTQNHGMHNTVYYTVSGLVSWSIHPDSLVISHSHCCSQTCKRDSMSIIIPIFNADLNSAQITARLLG